MRSQRELLGLKGSGTTYKQAVLWCEEKYIRRLEVTQRQELIDNFDEKIDAYCTALDCPFDDEVERFLTYFIVQVLITNNQRSLHHRAGN